MSSDTSIAANSIHVCICACTYKRPQGLESLLSGLESQTYEKNPPPHISIIIADNEVNPVNEQICHEFSQRTSISLNYVPVMERGISYARNACLDHAPSHVDFIAFLDDDEIPEPDWLDQLLETQARTKGDVIFGPVLPSFSEDVPEWIKQGHFFETPRWHNDLEDGQELASAATGNCLLLNTTLKESGLGFDRKLALSGGEDKLFFRQIRQMGYRIFWASNARVTETISPQRACFSYLLRYEFRRGNLKLIIKLQFPQYADGPLRKMKLVLKIFAKSTTNILSGMGIMAGALLLWKNHKDQFFTGAFRISEGLGMFASILGFRYLHYR